MNDKTKSDLLSVARRVVWFEPPEEVIKNHRRFLCYVMRYGTVEDVLTAQAYYTKDDFRDALDNAPAGALDPKSWSYWNLMLNDNNDRPYPTRNAL